MPTPPRDLAFFDKVNYVIDAWARPCNAPWYIYIEVLKPALMEAFITLLTFGWDDVARGYARPKGLQRRTGKKPGRGKARGLRGFPELGELIGEQLPGSEELKGAKWSNGLKTLWRIDSAMQQVLFWWMVADVTNDLAYNFTSVLYETRWCQEAGMGRFSWHNPAWRLIPGGFWWIAAITVKDYNIPDPGWGGLEGATGDRGALISFALTIRRRAPFNPPTIMESRLVDTGTGKVLATSGEEPVLPDGSVTFLVQYENSQNVRFEVQMRHNSNWAEYGNSVITGMGN